MLSKNIHSGTTLSENLGWALTKNVTQWSADDMREVFFLETPHNGKCPRAVLYITILFSGSSIHGLRGNRPGAKLKQSSPETEVLREIPGIVFPARKLKRMRLCKLIRAIQILLFSANQVFNDWVLFMVGVLLSSWNIILIYGIVEWPGRIIRETMQKREI